MNHNTGEPIFGVDHLRQSIIDILTTPIGSRVMRRDYGSRLYELIDAPINRSTLVDIYAAVAHALMLWEPRFELTRVQVESIDIAKVQIYIEGNYLPDNTQIKIEGLIL